MKIRGVLFDLDGTLLDQDGAVDDALRRWLPTLGVAPEPHVLARWHEIQERHLGAWRERRITFAEQRRRRLRDFLPEVGVAAAAPDLDHIFAGYLRCYQASWRAFDDADDALTAVAAAGLAVAVLTNGTTEQQNDKLARVGLAGRVGPVWTVDNLGVAKPDTGAFLGACARWGLPPAAVLSVGDRHDLDVLPARAAGLSAVLLDRHGTGPADEPHRVGSLRELTF
ncbi:HAD family hydrolase [Jidongwangia harbinensis]|uniref:HAD family hydrolase n=1 Tax=Jidongwangia harbinensis TaxID=2878561 RepID=UPI001CD9FC26|nr:HAD family hydrolase [Jidongwangia harbinensis]MCA2217707.1 HAD family hydrolase [Jidongwangia harbinensis]